ncbi:MAG: FIG01122842: hypothetical protein, partial [uncultured Corynebacteriales bacterium]
ARAPQRPVRDRPRVPGPGPALRRRGRLPDLAVAGRVRPRPVPPAGRGRADGRLRRGRGPQQRSGAALPRRVRRLPGAGHRARHPGLQPAVRPRRHGRQGIPGGADRRRAPGHPDRRPARGPAPAARGGRVRGQAAGRRGLHRPDLRPPGPAGRRPRLREPAGPAAGGLPLRGLVLLRRRRLPVRPARPRPGPALGAGPVRPDRRGPRLRPRVHRVEHPRPRRTAGGRLPDPGRGPAPGRAGGPQPVPVPGPAARAHPGRLRGRPDLVAAPLPGQL